MCTKETGLLCLSAVVWGGARGEFQGWEVRYELVEIVIAREHLGETGSLETAKGETNTFQNGDQVGTAGPAVRRQGNHRVDEVSAARAGIQRYGAGSVTSRDA